MRVLITGSTGELGRELGRAVEDAAYVVLRSGRRSPPEAGPSGREWVHVAERLARCIGEGPGGRLPDFGGPEVLTLGEAAQQWKEVRKIRKPVVPVPLPGRIAAAFREGRNTVPGGELGRIRWRDWLLSRCPA